MPARLREVSEKRSDGVESEGSTMSIYLLALLMIALEFAPWIILSIAVIVAAWLLRRRWR